LPLPLTFGKQARAKFGKRGQRLYFLILKEKPRPTCCHEDFMFQMGKDEEIQLVTIYDWFLKQEMRY
jgi:hypothetical protein